MFLVWIALSWLPASLLVTAVACALCRGGRLEDVRLGYDSGDYLVELP